ncbi:MAG: hypothetical protein GF381_02730 [Candidatus Pacebacteria bacterium]|nr:hypothetical protein [Candidatus Paceibacterota bacterium]
MNDNIKFLLLFLVGLGLSMGLLVFRSKYLDTSFFSTDDSQQEEQSVQDVAQATYDDARQKAEEMIKASSQYQELGGENLELTAKQDSQLEYQFSAADDGVSDQTDSGKIYQARVEFKEVEEGQAELEAVYLIDPDNESRYYDLVTDKFVRQNE